jgi:inner membrane protein
MKKVSTIAMGAQVWVLTAGLGAVGFSSWLFLTEDQFPLFAFFIILVAFAICTLPALVALVIFLKQIRDSDRIHPTKKISHLLGLLLAISFVYGILISIFEKLNWSSDQTDPYHFLCVLLGATGIIFILACIAISLLRNTLSKYFFNDRQKLLQQITSSFTTNKKTMEPSPTPISNSASNKILIKGLITGGLILLMLIPTIFVKNLIFEREARQKEAVQDVSSKWALAQTLSSPFLVVPYSNSYNTGDNKIVTATSNLILLANNMTVNGKIIPVQRPRSIFKVLLYRSEISFNGNFKVELPPDIDSSKLDYQNARLCFTLSDFKGIEEDIYVKMNNQTLLLRPGLPVNDFGKIGLSVPVKLDANALATGLPFTMDLKLKGSEQLHFIPMSASSKFKLASTWNDPSFDGEMLPNERQVTKNGFTADWSFNQANLPFATVIKQNTVPEKKFDFGLSLVQPADQYDKTLRSVKYAILFIGLSFAFFFMIELMQKRPFHPVQYVLVGIALVIFYTLLLSISEYLSFDTAYIIASLATILLISLYAKGHFKSWKTAGIFFGLLSLLYSFIFILIRLEDTALLVGSIGLFVVLALVMFASQKINWYGKTAEDKNSFIKTNTDV